MQTICPIHPTKIVQCINKENSTKCVVYSTFVCACMCVYELVVALTPDINILGDV